MKILAINGSPRGKKSNTDRILQPFLAGAREAGAETETVYLKEHKINYCLGCFNCWTVTPGVCVQKDDMAALLEKIRGVDMLIYASPLYIFNVTAQMKTFLDRFAGRVTHIDYFAPNGTHIIRATFEGKRVRRKLRMPRRVLVELPLSQTAIRLDLGRLRMNPDLPPEAFEQPAFDSATHIDIDAEPVEGAAARRRSRARR